MKKLVTRFYYSMWDIFDLWKTEVSWNEKLDVNPNDNGMGHAFADLAVEDNLLADGRNWENKDDSVNKVLWNKYLWPEFCQVDILYIDVETNPWEEPTAPTKLEVLNAFADTMLRMLRWWDESTERYSILITNLNAIKTDLLKQLGSENLTLFNDTPQDGGTDFTTSSYVTNATKVTSKSDVATPIARLKEVEEKLRNYYADWADEFNRFVILSA